MVREWLIRAKQVRVLVKIYPNVPLRQHPPNIHLLLPFSRLSFGILQPGFFLLYIEVNIKTKKKPTKTTRRIPETCHDWAGDTKRA